MKAPAAILELKCSVQLDDYVVGISWADDSQRLAVAGGEGGVYLAERQDKALQVKKVGDHGLGALAVAWQPQGESFISSGQDSSIVAWSGVTGAALQRRRPATAWSEHLRFTADGQYLASAAGKQIFLWSANLEPQSVLPPLEASVAALAWDKAGRELGAAIQGGILVHRFDPNPSIAAVQTRPYKWAAACVAIAFSPNGRFLATGTQDGSVHFWYLGTGKDSQMRGYPGKVNLLEWSHDGRYLSTIADNQVVVWDFGGKGPEGSRPKQLSGHTDRIECLAAQRGGPFLVSGGRDWRLSLWWPGKASQALDAHLTDSEPSCLQWSPNGCFIAVGERKGKLSIYELEQL